MAPRIRARRVHHDIQPERKRARHQQDKHHGQCFAQHSGEDTDLPVKCLFDFLIDVARKHTGGNAGDQTRNGSRAVNVYQKTVRTGNHAGDNSHPRTEQDPAGHNGDGSHVNQRPFDVDARERAENGKQRENRCDRRQLKRLWFSFSLCSSLRNSGVRGGRTGDQHQRCAVKAASAYRTCVHGSSLRDLYNHAKLFVVIICKGPDNHRTDPPPSVLARYNQG